MVGFGWLQWKVQVVWNKEEWVCFCGLVVKKVISLDVLFIFDQSCVSVYVFGVFWFVCCGGVVVVGWKVEDGVFLLMDQLWFLDSSCFYYCMGVEICMLLLDISEMKEKVCDIC